MLLLVVGILINVFNLSTLVMLVRTALNIVEIYDIEVV